MKNNVKKIINISLLVGVLLVWGIIVYQLFFNKSEDALSDNDIRFIGKAENSDTFVFPDDAKDPFFPLFNTKKSASKKDSIQKPVQILPGHSAPLVKLLGIIGDNKSNLTAILEFDDGTVEYVKQGEKIRELSIISITQSKMTYTAYDKNFELIIE